MGAPCTLRWFVWQNGFDTGIYRVAKGGGFPVFFHKSVFLEALAVDDTMVHWGAWSMGPKVWIQAMPK